jgi:predicted  nucleic acid-binding Zn-ribbon protein
MAYLPILCRIQEIYSRIHVLKQTVDELTNDSRIKARESTRSELKRALAKNDQELHKLKSSERGLDLEIKTCAEHLEVEDKRLYGGSITSSRELELIQKKVAEYRTNKAEMEEQLLKLMEEDEKLTVFSADITKRFEAFKAEIEVLRSENTIKIEIIVGEARDLKAELNELQSQVPAELLERYKKVAKNHYGVGISRLKSDCCGACHVGLSDALMQKVKRGDDIFLFCENCGRIICY